MAADSLQNKKRKLKHVKIYDQLYERIQNGAYPSGSQLPSENHLAEEMNASRMTLRKALSLLRDDGLIQNIPGVGHFVLSSGTDSNSAGEKTTSLHPVYTCCTEKITSVELSFRIEPPTPAIEASLGQYTPAVVIADRWYKHDSAPVAYTLSMIPIEIIGAFQIDLNDSGQLLDFLEKTCYTNMDSGKRTCTHSASGNFSSVNYTLSEHNSFLLVQEALSDSKQTIFLTNKHYIPFDLFKIEMAL